MELHSGERIDYIAGTKLAVIQSPDVFSFSIDAVLLGRFVRVPIQKGRILDLCSGNGVIPCVLTERTKAKIIGVEIQERLVDMATRTIAYNELENQIEMVSSDLNTMPKEIPQGSFDVVTCNPPYFKTVSEKERNHNPHFAIARHELYCSLEDVIRVSSQYVKQKGKVALVHRPERLADIISYMKKYRVEPKRMQLIHSAPDKEATMLLIEGIKDGQAGITVVPPLFIYNEDRTYTKNFRKIYEGK